MSKLKQETVEKNSSSSIGSAGKNRTFLRGRCNALITELQWWLTRTSVIYVHVFTVVMPANRLMLNPLLTSATIIFKVVVTLAIFHEKSNVHR